MGASRTIISGFVVARMAGMVSSVMMASIREQLEVATVPSMARGMGLVLIVAGSLSLAFMGFAGLFS